MPFPMSDYLDLTDEDDGQMFIVHVINTGERRIASEPCRSSSHAVWANDDSS